MFRPLLTVLLLGGMMMGKTVFHNAADEWEQHDVYVVRAKWKMESLGFGKSVPCDPPAPKGSNIACSEPVKAWRWHCPDETIDVLPRDRNDMWRMDGKKHEDTWCVVVKPEPKP